MRTPRESRARLARDIEDIERLHDFGARRIDVGDEPYEEVLDIAVAIMRADFASIQTLDHDRGELQLLAWRNFHPRSAAFWRSVSTDDGTTCGAALGHGERVVIPDVRADASLKRSKSQRHWKLNGIVAIQSTPLTTRDGRVLGMMSTHWRRVHTPDARELRLFDLLVRQTADMLERRLFEVAIQSNEKRMRVQAEAFRAVVRGAPLDISLGILARAVEAEVPEARTAFYVADLDVTRLHPIRGRGDALESYEHSWSFPIKTAVDKPIGGFAVYLRERRDATTSERELVDTITRAAAIIIERHTEMRARAHEELEAQRRALLEVEQVILRRTGERDELRRQLVRVEEGERRRLSRELHDQLGQELTAFHLGLEDVTRLIAKPAPRGGQENDAQLSTRIKQLQELTLRMIQGARYVSLELRPPELDDVGFESALETYIREWSARYGVAADLSVSDSGSLATLPDDVGSALYRITQEALTNVAKPAVARNVSVVVESAHGEVRMVIEDDGRGFDDAAAQRARLERRHGIAGMRERAALAGGHVEIESGSETLGRAGTTVYVRIPLDRSDEQL
jgi:signal transduction histidine kinase